MLKQALQSPFKYELITKDYKTLEESLYLENMRERE
jgi:hypothetical protein